MKFKHIIVIFILGFILIVLGALFKILHWQFASELLTAGTFLKIISAILLIWKLLTNKNYKDILNQ
ncbi:GldL-related protein [Tenacibaculum aquimarinum]|uniref:GldL-related protein n=1 Tax=Tenacibaculum aquimarinum TaxID=2910675 RepID=UPI001F0B3FD2|nr:gliding motility protein GldL [Tenacibaculum aquimarinum]MCH3884080.1 gliding motility protein GldL [Tenacibaculum aquimarinum]